MAPAITSARSRPIRAISFDAGETLVRPYPSFARAFGRLCRRGGVRLSAAQAAEIDAAAARRMADYRRRGLVPSTSESTREFWLGLYRDFLASVGARPPLLDDLAEQVYDGFTRSETYRLFYDARPALRAAKRLGLRVGVLSNWEPWLERLLVDLKIDHLLDFVVISGVCGYEKPDRRIFEKALAAAGVSSAEILHVGDSLHADVEGARAAGLTPVLVDRHNRFPEAECLRVASLKELTAPGGVIESMNGHSRHHRQPVVR